MILALTVLGWLAALWCAAVTLSSVASIVAHAVRTRRLWNAPGLPLVPLEHACAMLTALALLGVLPEPDGAILAAVPGVPLAIVLASTARKDGFLRALAIATWLSPREGGRVTRGAVGRLRGGPRPRRAASPAGPGPAAAPATAPAPPAAAAARTVPPLREDPALGPPPGPDEVAASVPVPVPWDELASWLAAFEPETDNDQSAHVAGISSGLVRVAEGIRAHADIIVNDVGLDPAYGGALLELADIIAAASGDAALVEQRYQAIYGAIKDAVDNGLVLPHRARQFFGGGDGSAPAADGTAA